MSGQGGPAAPRELISADDLDAAVRRVAAELTAAYSDGLVLVAVLKGSVPFLADLVRHIPLAVEVDFLAISRYAEGTGRVRIVKDLDIDIAGRDVVLIEDIVDTGLTLRYLLSALGDRAPASLEVVTLLDKSARRIVPLAPRYVGFDCPDRFVVGYGLDLAERYRNLPDIFQVDDLPALTADPDALMPWLRASSSGDVEPWGR